MRAVSLIEPLEDRIAPATVTISNGGRTASFNDANGDKVVVTTTKGAFTAPEFTFDTNNFLTLDIHSQGGFTGANLAFSITPVVTPGQLGQSTYNVGFINATNVSLGSVTVPGDLGGIDAGNGVSAVGLTALTVNSLGTLSNSTGTSNIHGTLGNLNVAGDVDGTLFVQNFNSRVGSGNINKMTIGGSVNGGSSSAGSGDIFFTGVLGTAVINGGLEGGANAYSGSIGGYDSTSGGFGTFSRINSIKVLGTVPDDPNPQPPGILGTSIAGGSGFQSGEIAAVNIGTVFVAGDVFGATGDGSGSIQGGLSLSSVTIGGSLVGGNFASGSPAGANSAGTIFSGKIGTILVQKSVFGGSGLNSGEILSTGAIQKVTIMGDLTGGSAGSSTSSGASGIINGQSIGTVSIQGSIFGGNVVSGDSNQLAIGGGEISSNTTIGSITVAKNVVGGTGASSGLIQALGGNINSLTIGASKTSFGNLVGGAGSGSGSISADGNIGKLLVNESITGGSGTSSGTIAVHGTLGNLQINGSLTGGTADNTGTISVFGALTTTKIGGGITGSSSGATMLTNTGYIQANSISSMTVTGALTAGTAGTGGLDTSGAIRSVTTIGNITVGTLVGNSTNPAIISAVGVANLSAAATSDVAIRSITIKGPAATTNGPVASYADILAGYSTDTSNGANPLGTGVSADAQIGTVNIQGNITATNIVAGVAAGTNGFFGNSTSAAISGFTIIDMPHVISKISKIIVTGTATPLSSGTDTFGIAAQYITSASVDGSAIALKAGASNDTFAAFADHLLGTGGDTFLYEV
jgi:hypothetical protein